MKTKPILCFVIVLCLLTTTMFPPAAAATEPKRMFVAACGNLTDHEYAEILTDGSLIFIRAEDAALFSGFTLAAEADRARFDRSGKQLSYTTADGLISYDDKLWLPLESTMAELQTVCAVADGTLLFYGSNGTLEELLAAADEPLQNGGNSLDFMGGLLGSAGFAVATIYDVLSVRDLVKAVTGEMTRERYMQVVSELVQPPADEETLLDMAKSANKGMGFVTKVYKYLQSGYDLALGDEAAATAGLFMGQEGTANFVEAMDAYSGVTDYIDIGNYLDLLAYYAAADSASELYIAMLEGSLLNPLYPQETTLMDMVSDDALYPCVEEVVSFYRNGKADFYTRMDSLAVEIMATGADVATAGLTDVASTVAKGVASTLSGITNAGEYLSSIKKTISLKHIQDEARVGYNCALDKIKAGEVTEDSVSLLKYSAMLYLKAAHDAYALYSFDSTINTAMACSRLNEHIIALAGFDEEQICRAIDNGKIDAAELTETTREQFAMDYLGWRISEIIDQFGADYSIYWLSGYVMCYADLGFGWGSVYGDAPSDNDVVSSVNGYGDAVACPGIKCGMTANEIAAEIGTFDIPSEFEGAYYTLITVGDAYIQLEFDQYGTLGWDAPLDGFLIKTIADWTGED